MGLADLAMAAGEHHDRPKPVAVSVKVEPLDCKHAAADVLKAVKANDVNALEDALRRFFVAVDEEEDGEGEDDEHKEEGDEEEAE